MAEQLTLNQRVEGSNPSAPTRQILERQGIEEDAQERQRDRRDGFSQISNGFGKEGQGSSPQPLLASMALITYTLERTNLYQRKPGDEVNESTPWEEGLLLCAGMLC